MPPTSCSAGWPSSPARARRSPGSEYLAELYDVKGASKNFDGVAPHPYGKSINKVSGQVDLYREVIKDARDTRSASG